MDPHNIERLVSIFQDPEVDQALATLRVIITVRNDLPLGSEALLVEFIAPEVFTAVHVLVDHDDSSRHTPIALLPLQAHAASVLWRVSIENEHYAARVAPHDQVGFLAAQADTTERQLGIRLGGEKMGPLCIMLAPMPRP